MKAERKFTNHNTGRYDRSAIESGVANKNTSLHVIVTLAIRDNNTTGNGDAAPNGAGSGRLITHLEHQDRLEHLTRQQSSASAWSQCFQNSERLLNP